MFTRPSTGRPRAIALLGLVLAWATACSDPGDGGKSPAAGQTQAAPAPQATTVTRPAVESPRSPNDAQRSAMLEILGAETTPERRIWFAVGPGNAETKALVGTLAAIFEQAGWKSETSTLTGMVLKPGIAVLMAEEEPPTYPQTALKALEAGGLEVKSGTGYRSYSEEMKRENPIWAGIPLAADQAFVVVIGPQPKP